MFCLWAFGVLDNPSVLEEGVTYARVASAALSVALTSAALLLLNASHPPPSGATVLIVSLGLLQTFSEMVALLAGIVVLTVTGWLINRLFSVPAPVWAAKDA